MLVFLNWWSIRHLHYAAETLWVCETVISRYQASDDDFLLEKSLVVFATFQGQYQESPEALQMLSLQVGLRPCQFVAYCLLVLSIRQPYTSGLSLGCSRLRRPIPVASICQASSVSAENYPCIAVSFWRLFPSPSQVGHLRSACPALYLLQHLPHLPKSPSSSELARTLRQSPIAFNIWSNVFLGFLVVNPTCSEFVMSSCSCIIAISVSATRFHDTVVPPSI